MEHSHQRRFFRGGKSTNKIIAVFIPDFVSYMKMSRLIKQEKFFVSLLLSASNRKCYCYRSDKELVVVELINRWHFCLQVGNRNKFLLGYHGNGCSIDKKTDLFCLYIQYRSSVQEASPSDSYLQRASVERNFSCSNRVRTFLRNSMTQEWISALACISIEKGILKKLQSQPHMA